MKRLVLALLVCGTAIFAAGNPSPAAADCVHHRIIYYESPGGPSCGYSWYFCDAPVYHQGCTTSYTQYLPGCICP